MIRSHQTGISSVVLAIIIYQQKITLFGTETDKQVGKQYDYHFFYARIDIPQLNKVSVCHFFFFLYFDFPFHFVFYFSLSIPHLPLLDTQERDFERNSVAKSFELQRQQVYLIAERPKMCLQLSPLINMMVKASRFQILTKFVCKHFAINIYR